MSETSTIADRPKAARPIGSARGFKRNRMLIPVGIAMALIVFTLITVVIESPDTDDSDYLSPQATSDIGSSILAGKLADAGITVERFTDAQEAFVAAGSGATVFIPAAEYLSGDDWYELATLRSGAAPVNLVAVMPPTGYLDSIGLWPDGDARIATDTLSPDEGGQTCALPGAQDAGEAQVGRQRYRLAEVSGLKDSTRFCYDGSIAWYGNDTMREVVVGADDPFTNQHIGEAGNEALALSLLSGHDKVVWLDIHALTPPPQPSEEPSTDQPTTEEPTTQPPRREIQYPGAGETSPVYDALPSWMWAGLIGILLLGVLAAVWRGRRLGPPVTEPLPVTVPAAETVHGRARLYRRAHAYTETLRALRAGALHRMLPVLRLSSQATETEIIAAASQRSGWTTEQVALVLYQTEPADEAELFAATHALDTLVLAVENARPQGRD